MTSPALLLLLATSIAAQVPPTASDIMQRVTANQESADLERTHYTYIQHVVASSLHGHKLLCTEVTESRITPGAANSSQQLLTLKGQLWSKDHYIVYDHPPHKDKDNDKASPPRKSDLADDDTDLDLVENMRNNLTNSNSKDGFNAGLFPLTQKALPGYVYTLAGRETINGRDTWHIRFKPRSNSDFDWKGDAWIDTVAYQPVLVDTRLSRGVPFLVKTMLGTNVPGLGFRITYAPSGDTWFPSTFGTEFKIHVLFLFSRTITISVQNRDFAKTHVTVKLGTADLTTPVQP